MEEDDEFGDLYTDVIRPLEARFQPQHEDSGSEEAAVKAAASQDRSVDLNFDRDDEKTPHLKTGTSPGRELNSSGQEKTLPARGGFNLNLNSDSNSEATARIDGLVGKGGDGSGFEARVLENGHGLELRGKSGYMDDDDDLGIILEEREEKGEESVKKNNNNFMIKGGEKNARAAREEFTMNFVNDAAVDEMEPEQSIPGLSGRMENPSAPTIGDEWESEESYDDLQIVLNDDNHGPMGMERMPGMIDDDKDDDGEPLVIVVDEQEAGGEEEGCGDVEKDLGDAFKASGEGGVDGPAAAQTTIVYSNRSFHNPFSSQFKYATLPGAAAGGITGQIRPFISTVPPAGHGSGVWRPAAMNWPMPVQKGYHRGYGILAGGVNVAGRGSGFNFGLPSYKSIFEVDIDSFKEKPWKLPCKDVSDFFIFGLNEDSWRDYCKQLGQLQLEMTMQSRVRAYESCNAEQNYNPDLPPGLAAAVGSRDNPSENANHGKINAGPNSQTSPVGRPIPVETGSGDRLPSIDTRCLRMHDMDAIIEIICHSSKDGDDVSEQQDNDPARKDRVGGGDETDGLQQPEYNGAEWVFDSRRPHEESTRRKRERDGGSDRDDEVRYARQEWHRIIQNDHLSRREQREGVENDFLHQRGSEDLYALRTQLNGNEKRSRYDKSTCRDERLSYGSDTSRMSENKRKQTSRMREDGGSVSETANLRGHTNHQSSTKHRDDASTDNEQPGSRRGRPNWERWTSHKETDTASSSLKRTYQDPQPLVENEDTGPETNDNDAKAAKDRHLDTAAKLKKRSERFKLPLPTETESEQLAEMSIARPARKRRWTSNKKVKEKKLLK